MGYQWGPLSIVMFDFWRVLGPIILFRLYLLKSYHILLTTSACERERSSTQRECFKKAWHARVWEMPIIKPSLPMRWAIWSTGPQRSLAKTADVFFFGNAQPRLKSKPDNIQVLWIEAGSLDQMPFKQHGMDWSATLLWPLDAKEVTSWYRENCTKPPPIPMAPSAPKPLRMAPRQKFYAKITGPMTPRQKTSTELGLQRSSKVPGHFSEERFTPIIYEKTYDFPSRGYGDVKLQDWQHGGCLVETGLVSCHMVIFQI